MSKTNPVTVSSWTLGDQCGFEERVAAAKAAGFEGIGLRAETYVDALAEGLHDEDILAILNKYGIAVTEVEYITLWAEEHRSYEQMYKEQVCFHMCELFGVNHINCGLMEKYSVEHDAKKLAELCRRAGKYVIGVEPMPYSGIPDVRTAWAIVKASGADNAKLIPRLLALDTREPALRPRAAGRYPGGEDSLHPDQRRPRPPLRQERAPRREHARARPARQGLRRHRGLC